MNNIAEKKFRYNIVIESTGRFFVDFIVTRETYHEKLKDYSPGCRIGYTRTVFAFRNVEEKARKKGEKMIEKIKKRENKKVIN